MDDLLPELMTKSDLCKYLSCSERTIENYARDQPGFPRAIKLGTNKQAKVYFKRAEISAWLDLRQGDTV